MLRNTVFGVILRCVSNGGLCKYPDELDSFELPTSLHGSVTDSGGAGLAHGPARDLEVQDTHLAAHQARRGSMSDIDYVTDGGYATDRILLQSKLTEDKESKKSPDVVITLYEDSIDATDTAAISTLWYGPQDRENPRNWSSRRKAWVAAQIWSV